MNFNQHSDKIGKHAFLSPSQNYWINYDPDQLRTRYVNSWSSTIGTALHDIARRAIKHRIRLGKADKKMILLELIDNYHIPRNIIASLDNFDSMIVNLVNYIRDCIGYGMTSEQILYYSDYCFGTADAISFDEDGKFLRIHDLKTGLGPTHMEQLETYAALFCLEYVKKPNDIQMELRIYQTEEVKILQPEPKDISDIMKEIKSLSLILDEYRY